MQAAELVVEIDKSGADPDQPAFALIGGLGLVHGFLERILEGQKPSLSPAGGGEIEELLLRSLDLLRCRVVEVLAKSVVDDILADRD